MRDPNRIYKFCNQLANLWINKCPDWRFCQMIDNVFYSNKNKEEDPFYFEEDKAIQKIEEYFKKHSALPKTEEKVVISRMEYEELLCYRKIYEDFHG